MKIFYNLYRKSLAILDVFGPCGRVTMSTMVDMICQSGQGWDNFRAKFQLPFLPTYDCAYNEDWRLQNSMSITFVWVDFLLLCISEGDVQPNFVLYRTPV
jgi:hypothetical protein